MTLALSDLSTLSRLLDEAMDLDPEPLARWLSALPEEQAHLLPSLREMLAERGSTDHVAFMSRGPTLDFDADNAAAWPGDLVGPYRLIREIGHGGMSTVWLGERADGTVKRSVAIKIPSLTLTSSAQTERFERERDFLAMLTHPRIARLYDAGVAPSGRPFIVLEYVDGLPITEACDARSLNVPARLRLFLQVLDAVEYAHKHLVVHRDIKPSNVFVDGEGEVKLLDFGIAKLVDDPQQGALATALTRDEGCALTPAYAAPEQIDRRPISTATDVYSLGVLLYELLTSALPHAEAQRSMAEAVQAALHAEPVPPSWAALADSAAARRGVADTPRLRSQLAGDLDTIVMKALRRIPAERYGSVEQFAADLRRFLACRPIKARPASFMYGARLFLRRHRAVGVAALFGVAGALAFASAAWQQHQQSLEERTRGDAVRDFMFDLVDDAEIDEQHPNAEPTGRQMIATAVQRARDGFVDQPRLRGELLAELGRMRSRLGDTEEAAALLEEALALLETNAPPDDPALNKARAHLAGRALEAGQNDRAQALATRALTQCTTGRECAKARFYANTVLCHLDLRAGQAQWALARMRRGAQDSELGFGAKNTETALALLQLAVVARQAGELDEARQTLDRALAISHGTSLRLADRIELSRTRAVVSLDLGDYAGARTRLLDLLKQTLSQDEQAQDLRILSTAQLALGAVAEARSSTEQALALASPSTHDVEPALAHQAHARALSLAGVFPEAAAEMLAVIQSLRDAGYAPNAMEVLRARRFLAEVHVRAGEFDTGLRQLIAVSDNQAQPGQEIELANTFDLIGCVLRESGRASEARTWHDKAGHLFEKKLAADHPLRLRNALYAQAAAWRAQPTPEGTATWTRLAGAYAQKFPADSVWRTFIARALQADFCPRAQAKACALIL